jgi:hypothetical protein
MLKEMLVLVLLGAIFDQDPPKEKSGEAPKEERSFQDIQDARSAKGQADDDLAKKREAILGAIRAKLEAERKALLEKVGKVIDEELNKAKSPEEQRAELERRQKELKAELRKVNAKRLLDRWVQKDAAAYEEARDIGMTAQDAGDAFNEAFHDHRDKAFERSTAGFKAVYYAFFDTDKAELRRTAATSAYNVACGYALWGKKEEAIDWLELSFALDFLEIKDTNCHASMIEHVRTDADLEGLRGDGRYKELTAPE